MKKVKGGVLLLLLSGLAFASQEFLLAPDGRHIRFDGEAKTLPKELTKTRSEVTPQVFLTRDEFPIRWPDTGTHYTFGYSTGDSMAHWMVPLAAAEIHKILIYNVDFTGKFCFFINDALYDGEVTSAACADANGWVGYWAKEDSTDADPGESAFWLAGDNECFNDPPIGEELWPGLGIGCYTLDLPEETQGTWQELDLAVLGYPDSTSQPFMIAAGVEKTDPDSWGIGAWDGIVEPHHGLKFYEGTGTSGNSGWHIRSFGWDVYAMVEYLEDIPPFIEDVTILFTTVSQDPREVSATITDFDPTGGGNEGVAEALLWYSFNGGDPVSVAMSSVADTFSAEIPGGSPGDEIEYWITATDNADLSSESSHYTYSIFQPVEPNLFVNNSMYPDWIDYYYLFGIGLLGAEWPHDIWNGNWGPGTAELFAFYESVVDAMGGGPNMCSDGLDTWLDGGSKNLVITGDEYLGVCFYGWPDPMEIPAGDFAYDYLGLNFYSADINYGASGDQYGVSRLFAVQDDIISGDLFDFLADSLYLNYDPDYEIGASNWLDGVGVRDEATVSYWGLSGILDSLNQAPAGADTHAVAAYMELANESKTAFFGFDALSLNSMDVGVDTLHGAGYHWIGIYGEGPIPQALKWMGVLVSVEDEVARLPSKFALHQNYPNPFNPVTTINFDLPSDGNVTLTVYNMLGQKVATLVNDFRRAGRHTITWNGTTDLGTVVATGVYLYRIDAGDFSATKKMILLK